MARKKLVSEKIDNPTRVGYKQPLMVVIGNVAPGAADLTVKLFKGARLMAQTMQWALEHNGVYKKLGAPRPQFEDGFEAYGGRVSVLADPTDRRGLAAKTLQQVGKLDPKDQQGFVDLLDQAPPPPAAGKDPAPDQVKKAEEFQAKLRIALDGGLKPVARLFPSAAGCATKLVEEVAVLRSFVPPKTTVEELVPVIGKQVARVGKEVEEATAAIEESLAGSRVSWAMLSAFWYEAQGQLDEILVIQAANPEAVLATRAAEVRNLLKRTKAAAFDILPLAPVGNLKNLSEFLGYFDKKTELNLVLPVILQR